MRQISAAILSLLLALSCSGGKTPETDTQQQESVIATGESSNDGSNSSAVSSSIMSKGTIESVSDVAVYCQLHEQVVKLNIHEGQQVAKGQTLIVLDEENLMNQLIQARNEFEQSSSTYEEILVGLGYTREEFDRVPENMELMARVKSSYNIREASLRQAERNYEKRNVPAPVSGTVTDIQIHQYDLPQSATPICHIFDKDHLKVVFNILESERGKIQEGNRISVTTIAYSNERHPATINMIASRVDENGMIKVEALLDDNHNLMPGMTALVDLKK